MFSGIVEALGRVNHLRAEATNLHLEVSCDFVHDLKIDQSVAHNGVCLTVVEIADKHYTVTAIEETLKKTNLGQLKSGDFVNLERCLRMGDRFDGHMVQGHVDQTATCVERTDFDGSWRFAFEHAQQDNVTVPKGSITVNGVSLTVVDSKPGYFSVAIIPYTFEHTQFQWLQPGQLVNLEFDVIGKYVQRYLEAYQNK
jgi:riboflavin synthase